MKHLLLSALLLAGLAGCKKSDSDPTPLSPTGGMWSLTSSTLVATSNGSSTTTDKAVIPNTVTLSFSNDGTIKLLQNKSLTGGGSSYFMNGTYILSNGIITTSYPGANYNGSAYVETSTVFTDHNLTLVHTEQGIASSTVTTDTYTR